MGLGNADKLVHIEVSADNMEARLIIEARLNPADISVGVLLSKIDAIGLQRPASHEALLQGIVNRYIATACERLECKIANGMLPVQGKHAELVIVETASIALELSSSGRIDHRERNSVACVRAGDVIASITPPELGIDGVDVFGQTVPAKLGLGLELVTDDSVELHADGKITAKRSGRVERTGNRVRINHRLSIDKSVDFATGNIRFPGDVELLKGIRDCFRVEAGANIVVRDLVDAAHLVAGGSIVLEHGIAARELGSLRAARDVKALYMSNVNASAGRDVCVDREVTSCKIEAGRSLIAPNATILRSDIIAASECEVGEVGSAMSTSGSAQVTIRLGELPGLQELIDHAASVVSASVARYDKAARRLQNLKGVGGRTSASHAELLTEAQFALTQVARMHEKTKDLVLRLHQLSSIHAKMSLTVHRAVHPGSRIVASGVEYEVTRRIPGPCVIELNDVGDLEVAPLLNGKMQPNRALLTKYARATSASAKVRTLELVKQLGIDVNDAAALSKYLSQSIAA